MAIKKSDRYSSLWASCDQLQEGMDASQYWDYVVFMLFVPKPLIVARYFARDRAAIELQQAEMEAAAASLAELEEEHGGEEGFLGALEKINKAEAALDSTRSKATRRRRRKLRSSSNG